MPEKAGRGQALPNGFASLAHECRMKLLPCGVKWATAGVAEEIFRLKHKLLDTSRTWAINRWRAR
jgi:hypothetical protein